jgi:transglutaminase-like putative cysteine protease
MKPLRSLPMLACAVVLLSIVGVSAATRSAPLLLVGGVLAALSWYVTEGPRGRALPNWTASVLVLAATLDVIVELALAHGDLPAVLGRFVVWLALIKLYQHKAPRDYAQLLGLSMLLMLIGCLQSNDLLFTAILLIYAGLGLYVLLLFQLYAAHEGHRAGRLAGSPAGMRPVGALQPIAGRRAAAHLRGLAAAVAAAGLAGSAVLFVLFPRDVGGGMLGLQSPLRRSGFSDDVDLLGGTRITASRRVVMTVRAAGGGLGPDEPLRLRGRVLDRYEGAGRWTAAAPGGGQVLQTQPPALMPLATPGSSPTVRQEFDVFIPGSTIFSVHMPVSVGTEQPRRLTFHPRLQTIEDADEGPLYGYTVLAQPDPSDAAIEAVAGRRPDDGARLVARFDGFDPWVRDLARSQLRGAGLPEAPPDAGEAERFAWNAAGAAALARYLSEGPFRYVTDLRGVRLDAEADPIVHFLRSTRSGHCEYFASALAALCNSAGIPARLVTGYLAAERDDEGRYVVRESNAHAWVEAQAGPARWRAFDPTPPGALDLVPGGRPSRADRWWWLLDRFEARWTDRFIGFDRDSQQRLLRVLDIGWGRRLDGALRATREWMAQVNRAFYFGPAGYLWMGIVALAIGVAAVALWTQLRRAARLRAAASLEGLRGAARQMRQIGFYLEMLDVLHKAGHPKPAWQPPLFYARVLGRQHPQAGELVRRIGELFYAARFGRRRLARPDRDRAAALVRELARSLAGPRVPAPAPPPRPAG